MRYINQMLKTSYFSDLKKYPTPNSEEYTSIKAYISSGKWNYITKYDFEKYKEKMFSMLNYQLGIDRDNDRVSQTISNYLQVLSTFQYNNSNLNVAISTIVDSIKSQLNSIKLLKDNRQIGTDKVEQYTSKKVLGLKVKLDRLIEYLIEDSDDIDSNKLYSNINNQFSDLIFQEITKYISKDIILDRILNKSIYTEVSKLNNQSEQFQYVIDKYKSNKPLTFNLTRKFLFDIVNQGIPKEIIESSDQNHKISIFTKLFEILEEYKSSFNDEEYYYIKLSIFKIQFNSNRDINNSLRLEEFNKLLGKYELFLKKNSFQRFRNKIGNEKIFLEMLRDFLKIRIEVENSNNRFYSLHPIIKNIQRNSTWYSDIKFLEQSDVNTGHRTVIDLLEIILKNIPREEDFEALNNLREPALKKGISRNLYNLAMSKFSTKAIGVAISKNMNPSEIYLENMWGLKLREYILNIDQSESLQEKEADIEINNQFISQINQGESKKQEFKSTFFLDLHKYLKEGINEKSWGDYGGSYIESIISFLNSDGGRLYVGVWENAEKERIQKEGADSDKLLEVFESNLLGDYCLTGIGYDLDFIHKNRNFSKTIDELTGIIENMMVKYITPNPISLGDLPRIEYIQLFNKTLSIIEIEKGKTYYHLKKKEELKFYVRTNHGKQLLKQDEAFNYIMKNPRSTF